MSISVRHVAAWVAAAVPLVPTAICNILPHYQAGETAATANQIVFVLAMASLPLFAIGRHSRVLKAGCILLGAGLFVWSLYNALHMGGQAQATATNPARTVLAKADAYRAQIAALEAQKATLPKHEITSDERVDRECKTGRGPNCQKREADRDITKRSDAIDVDIAIKLQKITDLGALPTEIDHAAAMIGDLGNVEERRVSKWFGFIYAFIVEGLAFVGPAAIISALTPKEGEKEPLPKVEAPTEKPKAPRRKVDKTEAAGKESQVADWKRERTVDAPGEIVLRVGDAHEDYKRWARLKKIKEPLNLTTFGTVMKDTGIKRVTKNSRIHYVGIALIGHPALKVVSS